MSKFKEGDKVKVVSGQWKNACAGHTGTLVKYDNNEDTHALWNFDNGFVGHAVHGGTTGNWYVKDEDLELVKPEWQPKVGDRVRVTTRRLSAHQFGKEGVISTESTVMKGWLVVEFDYGTNSYLPADLELLAPAKTVFETGQRVWHKRVDQNDELVTIDKLYLSIEGGGTLLYKPTAFRAATPAELIEADEKAAIAKVIERLKAEVDEPLYKIGEQVTVDDDDLNNKTGFVTGYLGYGEYKVAVVCNDNSIARLEYDEDDLDEAA